MGSDLFIVAGRLIYGWVFILINSKRTSKSDANFPFRWWTKPEQIHECNKTLIGAPRAWMEVSASLAVFLAKSLIF